MHLSAQKGFILAFLVTLFLFAVVVECAPMKYQAKKRKGQNPDEDPMKYFHEAGYGDVLGHYDRRYFTGSAATYDAKADTLHHMIRAYLTTFRELNLETWIAHGTLIGWWWNSKLLPWDWDLDTQVSGSTMAKLRESHNMTFHNYTDMADDGTIIFREYLLDVNPFSTEGHKGDGFNVIDARWIDIRNGLYIDITALREVEPEIKPGIFSCKNRHDYKTNELWPMRNTFFEGVPALIPNSYEAILKSEYSPRVMTNTFHEGHQWNPGKKEWIPAGNRKVNHRAHVPRSLQSDSDEKRTGGLKNLARIFF
ncbi:LicD family-domain-containing protein [Calycina marina]|uniref:LicD family-domain-containing protein n=1 Tax=Calycina marina TaxID=1763456 RepID=A0A9P8CB19_9HELO|nr:LicD family-domain-containing protein [Calycina marina]